MAAELIFLHKMRFLPLTGIIAFIFCPVSTKWLHRVYQQIRGREKGKGLKLNYRVDIKCFTMGFYKVLVRIFSFLVIYIISQ